TSSGAAGIRRGGLGYLKEFRALCDSAFLCVADRAILSCWGLRGGKAGAPFRVTVDPGGPDERVLPGLRDDAPHPGCGRPRGGGGWGGGGARARGSRSPPARSYASRRRGAAGGAIRSSA